MSSHRVIRNPDPEKLTLRGGRHYLERIAEQLKDSTAVFVTDVQPKQAFYYKKRLGAILKAEVVAEPGRYDSVDGYRFRVRKS